MRTLKHNYIFFISLFFSNLALATTIIPYSSLEKVLDLSQTVVLAKAVQNYEIQNGSKTYFRTDFKVLQNIKGAFSNGDDLFLQAISFKEGDITTAFSGDTKYEEGETYLLFLAQNGKGLWNPIGSSYYIFQQFKKEEKELLIPLQYEVEAITIEGRKVEPIYVYRQNALIRMLISLQNKTGKWDNEAVKSKYNKTDLVQEGIFRAQPIQCTWLGGGVRWQTFDSVGGSVAVRVDDTGCAVGQSTVSTAVSNMNAAYTGISLSGPSSSTIPIVCSDGGVSSILSVISTNEIGIIFNDPCDEFRWAGDTYSCTTGGLLGIGGASWSTSPSSTHEFNGKNFYKIVKGYVIMNDSESNCLCTASSATFRLAMTHELTHALGIGHHIGVANGNANMTESNAAEINNVDIECLDFTYIEESAVPIELLNFEGAQEHKNIQLDWTTATEINNSYFKLEKSSDGKNFEFLTKIEGAGTSAQTINYQFIDQYAYVGNNYYRLSQTDFDGTTEYFDIINVNFGGNTKTYLMPNPVASDKVKINYQTNKTGLLKVEIYDINGKLVAVEQKEFIKGVNLFDLDISERSKGIYFLKLITKNEIKTLRLMKL